MTPKRRQLGLLGSLPVTLLGSLLLLAACNMDGVLPGKSKGKSGGSQSDFAGKGSLCGTYPTFNGYLAPKSATVGKGDPGRAFKMMVALGVCGKADGGAPWKALAVSELTDEVNVKVGSAEAKSAVFIDEDLGVHLRRPDGRVVKIGKAAGASEGAPIKLEAGILAQVMIDGEAFSLEEHSKASPGKSVQISFTRD